MPFDRTVHHTVKTREGTMPGRVTPYIMLSSTEGQVILQGGKWYDGGGVDMDESDVPDWAWEQAKSLSAAAREEVGLDPLAEGAQAGRGVPMQVNAGDDGKASAVPQGAAAAPKLAGKK